MTTAGAKAVKLQAVGLNGKAVARGDFFLETLNVAILKLHDLSAAGANQVIVMALMGDIVILGLCAEVPGLGQAGFAKKVERAVDRCKSEMRILLRKLVVHLLGRNVFLLEKGV